MDHILVLIKKEAIRSRLKYNRGYASQHEAYAVALEEMDELWDEIKRKEDEYNIVNMEKEAIQIASVMVRFIHEFC